MAGNQVLKSPSATFPSALAESWIGNRATGLELVLLHEARVLGGDFTGGASSLTPEQEGGDGPGLRSSVLPLL